MTTGKVTKVRQGKGYTNSFGDFDGWWVEIDNGDVLSVNTQQADPPKQPWTVGEQAWYEKGEAKTSTKGGTWYSAKKKKAPDAAPSGNNQAAPGHSGGGWSKEKETSVMVQGLLKSIIESGAAQDQWKTLLGQALFIHDQVVASRLKPVEQPEPVHQGKPAPIGDDDSGDLPF